MTPGPPTGRPTPTPDHHGAGGPRRRRPRRRRTALAVAASLVLAGCNMYPTYGASPGATKQGNDTFKLYSGMMTTGIIIGGAVGLLILYTVFRYRKRSDAMPKQFHENVASRSSTPSSPILIVAWLFVFTVITENSVDATRRSTPPSPRPGRRWSTSR